jgi:hypothetical protein
MEEGSHGRVLACMRSVCTARRPVDRAPPRPTPPTMPSWLSSATYCFLSGTTSPLSIGLKGAFVPRKRERFRDKTEARAFPAPGRR